MFEKATVADIGDVRVLHVPCDLDVYTVPDLRDQTIEAVATGHYHLVVDLSATAYVDSTGLGLLVGTQKRVLAHGGSLALAGPLNEQPAEVLHKTGLVKVFDIADSVNAAIAARAGA